MTGQHRTWYIRFRYHRYTFVFSVTAFQFWCNTNRAWMTLMINLIVPITTIII